MPLSSPKSTGAQVGDEIVRVRKDNPRRGARAIQTHLRRAGAPDVPAVSTFIVCCNGIH